MSCRELMSCNGLIAPCELNKMLIPKCLKGKSYKYICAFFESCSKKSQILMKQILEFTHKMKLAKQYTVERKCYCPTRVEWAVCNPPLIISQLSLCNYYDFYPCDNTGFAFIIRKLTDVVHQNNVYRQMIQDGKEGCCRRGFCNCKLHQIKKMIVHNKCKKK